MQVPEMAFGEYWDTCEYTDGVLNYNQVRPYNCLFLVCSPGHNEDLAAQTKVLNTGNQPLPWHVSNSRCLFWCMQDGHRQRTCNWVDSTGGTNAAFDFTTKGILQEALARSELWRLVDAQVRARTPGSSHTWAGILLCMCCMHQNKGQA